MDDYANLVGIEVNGESRPLHWFHRFTYPEVKPESYFYGVSDLTKIHREWYTKDVLKKYRNIGLENFAFPIVLVTFDQYKYRRGSQEWDKLWELVNGIKNDARLMVPGSRNISEMAGILPDVDIKFLEPSFGGSGFNAFETAIESENKAIARNLGMPDNLGYSDVGSGSYAKSQTEYDLYWRNVVDIAEAVQDSVQEVVERLLRYNYPTERARFVFDLSRDKGITQEKVAILQGMIAAGVKPTKEYVAGFLDLGESDFDLNLDTVVINPASVGGNKAIEKFSKEKKDGKKKLIGFRYHKSRRIKKGSSHFPFCEKHDKQVIKASDTKTLFKYAPPNHPYCGSWLEPVFDGDGAVKYWTDSTETPVKGWGGASIRSDIAGQKKHYIKTIVERAEKSGAKIPAKLLKILGKKKSRNRIIREVDGIFYAYFDYMKGKKAKKGSDEAKAWLQIRELVKKGEYDKAQQITKKFALTLNNKRRILERVKVGNINVKVTDLEKGIYQFNVKSPKGMSDNLKVEKVKLPDGSFKIKDNIKVRFGTPLNSIGTPSWNDAQQVRDAGGDVVTLNEILVNAEFKYDGDWSGEKAKYKVGLEDIFMHEFAEIFYKMYGTGDTDDGRKYNNYWRKENKLYDIVGQHGGLNNNKTGNIGNYVIEIKDEKALYSVRITIFKRENKITMTAKCEKRK